MHTDEYYKLLSEGFQKTAGQTLDPVLAESYRALSEHYRALDFWHRRFAERYETPASHPPRRNDPS